MGTSSLNLYDRFMSEAEKNVFGVTAMVILFGSAWGSVAAYFIFSSGAPFMEVMIAVCLAMLTNAFAIAQAPTKWIMNTFLISFVINGILMLINAF